MNLKKYFAMSFIVLFGFLSLSTLIAQTETETPKESEVIQNLNKGCVVFLCFYSEKDPNIFSIKSNINSVADNFKGAVNPVYVSGDDKAEGSLRGKFEILPEETAVFVVMPKGNAVAKIEGTNITKENLMRALSAACGGGGCGSGCR